MCVCLYDSLQDLLSVIQNQENLFICLAAVLNMGNIEFGEDDNEYSFVKDKSGPLTTTAVSIHACNMLIPFFLYVAGAYGDRPKLDGGHTDCQYNCCQGRYHKEALESG